MSNLGPAWVKLAPDGTNPGNVQVRFQYILARCPGFIPFEAKLILFGAESNIPDGTDKPASHKKGKNQ